MIAIVVLAVVAVSKLRGGKAEIRDIWTTAQRDTFSVDIVESGEIRAVQAEFVKAPHEWRMDLQITDLVTEGTMVKKGDFLVKFDTTVLDEDLNNRLDILKQAEADLKSIDTQQASRRSEMLTNLEILRHSLEASRLKLEMMRYESRNLQQEAEIDLKTAEIRFNEAEKKIETQKIIDATERQKVVVRLEQARNNVVETRQRIEDLTITAPISGMVVYQEIGGNGPDNPRYKVSIGDKVNSGSAIISIPDLSQMKLVVKVNELDADKIRPGNRVLIRMDAFENEEFHGTVSYISTMIDKDSNSWRQQQKAPSFEVNVIIDETSELLKPGMTAQARIILEEIPDAVVIPIGTVFELDSGATVVYPRTIYPNPLQIRLGKRNNRFIVVESGLSGGEAIAWEHPEGAAHPLGWFAEMERRRTEFANMLNHIDYMNEIGITSDPARADSLRRMIKPPDVSIRPNGGAVEVVGDGDVTIISR
jgi:multidrug efflux pump subunit AcrA (membrane-fusion protein)